MARGKHKKYALIWCLESTQHLVIPLSSILVKNRIVDSTFNFHKKEVKLIKIGDQSAVESSTQEKFDALISNSNKRKMDEQIELQSSIFQTTKNHCSTNLNASNNIPCDPISTIYSRGYTMYDNKPLLSAVQYIPPPSLLPFEIHPNTNSSTDHFTMMDISYSSLNKNNTTPINREISASISQCTSATANQHQFVNSILPESEINNNESEVNSNESSNDFSSDESSTEQNPGFAFEVVSMMSKGKITKRHVAIQKQIYKAMKRQLKHQQSMTRDKDEIYEVPKYHFDVSDEK
ncbi:hypothetical protein PV327_011304, partial [Microctonus hyperodae]